MPKRYRINEEQARELKEARQKNKGKNVERRIKALLLHAEGEDRSRIAEKTDFAKTYISELVSKYCNNGLSAIVENNYHGNHRNLSIAEEEAVLAPFKKAAASGQIIEVSEIKRAYEEAIGRSLENSHGQIYNVLERHDWRKIMPRSEHPKKASEEAIEASKKLTKPSSRQW